MNTQKYQNRLPALRVSQALHQMLVTEAKAQHITLAEVHRQVLARGLSQQARADVEDDELNCPHCGGHLRGGGHPEYVTCEKCNATFHDSEFDIFDIIPLSEAA